MKSNYVNLFNIFTMVSVMIIFGSAATIFLSIYRITVTFLTTESGFELNTIINSWI